jgi:hypothetical protein
LSKYRKEKVRKPSLPLGVKIVDDRAKHYFPMPIDASG